MEQLELTQLQTLFWWGLAALLALQLLFLLRRRYLLRGLCFTACSGIGGLYLLNLVGAGLHLSIPVTAGTLGLTGVTGLPGCVLILFTKLICQV